jgi:hypothetical protein
MAIDEKKLPDALGKYTPSQWMTMRKNYTLDHVFKAWQQPDYAFTVDFLRGVVNNTRPSTITDRSKTFKRYKCVEIRKVDVVRFKKLPAATLKTRRATLARELNQETTKVRV